MSTNPETLLKEYVVTIIKEFIEDHIRANESLDNIIRSKDRVTAEDYNRAIEVKKSHEKDLLEFQRSLRFHANVINRVIVGDGSAYELLTAAHRESEVIHERVKDTVN